jgi:cellulose synthase/poly-beta-1,6-N-acetylglucosamine synthase-like glycosyltransferase
VAVRNEISRLDAKLSNIAALNYPPEQVEMIVVSDGSDDGTGELLSERAAQSKRFRTIVLAQHVGKAEALNRAIAVARGDIVVFTDARQKLEPESLRVLVSNFADPHVGCVSGELMLGETGSCGIGESIGLYWKLEKFIRRAESETGSVIGATGAFYAVRRELLPAIPAGTLLDDVYIPMSVVRRGSRVVFEPEARAWDSVVTDPKVEFRRKVRTLTGNYQLIILAPWIIGPRNAAWFEFVSHKLLRLWMPFVVIISLCLAFFVRDVASFVFLFMMMMTAAGAGIAALTDVPGLVGRFCRAALTFVTLNAAATAAFFNFVLRRPVSWDMSSSSTPRVAANR